MVHSRDFEKVRRCRLVSAEAELGKSQVGGIWCGNWTSVSPSLTWRILFDLHSVCGADNSVAGYFWPGAPDSYRIRGTPTPHFISRETEAWRSYDLSCPSPPHFESTLPAMVGEGKPTQGGVGGVGLARSLRLLRSWVC